MSITTKTRHRAAALALAATVGLTAFKVFVGVISGSVGVLSEAVHSFLDLISAAVSYFTVRVAVKPADEDHPFGHGKIETISSLFESILLIVAAVMIVMEGVEHVRHPAPIEHETLAIVTILISMVISWFIYKHNLHAAKETDSSALHVNALHFLSDVIASAGVVIGLVLLKFTGWQILDPITAFAVAAYIFWMGIHQVRKSLGELSDQHLPVDELEIIRDLLKDMPAPVIGVHDLRTRKSGVTRHIDFHLVMCGSITVDQSHDICDDLEHRISQILPNTSVNIHVEPCSEERDHRCETTCKHSPRHYVSRKKS